MMRMRVFTTKQFFFLTLCIVQIDKHFKIESNVKINTTKLKKYKTTVSFDIGDFCIRLHDIKCN